MLSREKHFTKINNFQAFLVLVALGLDFQLKLMILALTFTNCLCLHLVLLRSVKTSLILWL